MNAFKFTNPNDRADVLRMAWQLIKKLGISFGDALTQAYKAMRVKIKLATANAEGLMISFKKVDGTVRVARATRNAVRIPANKQPKGNRSDSGVTVAFFDLDLGDWRCFRIDLLLA